MANVILPERFKIKLEKNQSLEGIVNTTLSYFGELLEDNKLCFFSEYTNHGIKHIQDVLMSSDNLITDDTYSHILSDKDIGYYILSVILHDIGMHIDLEGFKYLIEGNFDDIRIEEFDNSSWNESWEEFLIEASKFNGKQLKSIFGNENTIVRVPPLSKPGEITENDKKLIGEFIRRNHPRLAHEISIKGFPAKPNVLKFADGLDNKSINIIGLIARSHGIGLRRCLDYIETKYGRENRRYPIGIHAIYLMVLIRIADYIQIDNNRSSNILLKIKTFSSPISEMEHNAHLSVDNIDLRWNDDPERIFVNASPKDSKMYLKLKKLIKDIQYEFDMSWAVLGELYGKGDDRDKAQIKYRRISSNLESETFIKQQDYVADSFSFKSNDEIIKLLVAPLYGDDPAYGVRELLQNALDACKEREIFEMKRGQDYAPLITVEIVKESNDIWYFIITDNGMGMDTDVIRNYFLSTGASYRRSSDWQKEFVDEKGKSVVRRSGRFGVGILSAFLIGQEIHVETKKVNYSNGFKFDANLNYEQIDILKDSTISEGTVIKIKIDQNKITKFKYRHRRAEKHIWYKWYTLLNPVVKYFLDGREISPYNNLNPDNIDNLPLGWQAIDSNGYDKILWSYSKNCTGVNFTCNGIIIPEKTYKILDLGLISNAPQISVFDNNAFLPLSLDRNTCTEKLSFNDELLVDLYKDYIAYMLILGGIKHLKDGKSFVQNYKLNYPGTRYEFSNSEFSYGNGLYEYSNEYFNNLRQLFNYILFSKEGFILNYNFFIKKLKTVKAILIQFDNSPKDGLKLDLQDRFIIIIDNKINSIQDYQNAIEMKNRDNEVFYSDKVNSRIFLKTDKYNFLFSSEKNRLSNPLKKQCIVKFEKYGFTCLHLGYPKPSLIDDDFLRINAKHLHFIREYEITCQYEGDSRLNELLERYIGHDVIIPFSVEERRKKYPLAFEELKGYMEKYINKQVQEPISD